MPIYSREAHDLFPLSSFCAQPPMELLRLPNLRWVALSRNPFLHDVLVRRQGESLESLDDPTLEDTNWPILGKGAGGVTRKVTWRGGMDVAVKTFVGELTSDGSPLDEKAISVAASSLQHESLIQLLGETRATGSLVMEFLDGFKALADPPSMQSCSRDVYTSDHATGLTPTFAWKIAKNLFHVLLKLHSEKGICHGDFYGHNILISPQTESVKLSDFGAAFFYDVDSEYAKLLQQVELRSYSVLVEEIFALVQVQTNESDRAQWKKLVTDFVESSTSFEGLLKHFT
jgi:serine/threonine protein kinase